MSVNFFCFTCGVDFRIYGAYENGCNCSLVDNLNNMSIEPEDDLTDSGLDLTLFYPPNFGLITDDAEHVALMLKSSEKFYSLS
jgi:hypothetical protein